MNPSGGGVREFVLQTGTLLRESGHEVRDVSLDPQDAPWMKDGAGIYGAGNTAAGWGFALDAAQRIVDAARGCHVLAIHGLWQNHVIAGAHAARRLGIPYVVFPHGMLDPWFQRLFPLKAVKKRLYWRLVEHPILSRASALIFGCEEERRLASGEFRPWKIREMVSPFGTRDPGGDEDGCQRAAWAGIKPSGLSDRFLLFLGRLHPKKGCNLLIEAFADWKGRDGRALCIVGGGEPDYVERLKRLAVEKGVVDEVVFTGPLQGDAKWGALREAETFVLPSHQENFGIAVVEALACATPVLISDKVNIHSEIVEDGAGFVDTDTRDGVSRLLTRWGAMDHGEHDAMRRNARVCFEQRYDLRSNLDRLAALLEEAIFKKV